MADYVREDCKPKKKTLKIPRLWPYSVLFTLQQTVGWSICWTNVSLSLHPLKIEGPDFDEEKRHFYEGPGTFLRVVGVGGERGARERK
jgi:hypothetical protein